MPSVAAGGNPLVGNRQPQGEIRAYVRRRFRVKPLDPGIKAPYRALSLNQLYDQIEAEEVRP